MQQKVLAVQRRRAVAMVCAGLALGTGRVAAEGGDMELTVPYAPGGIIDAVARQLRPLLAGALGQPVAVHNLPGAGGALGLQHLLARRPPAQAVLLGTESDLLLVPLSNPAVRLDPGQLRLVGLIGTSTFVLAARPQLPAASLQALLAERRADPALPPLSCADIGEGSYLQLVARAFGRASGLALLHVPYKGVAPLVQDLSAGHVDLAFLPLAGPIGAMVDAGRLRVLGVAAARPLDRLPGVPTIAAAAQLERFEHGSWSGLVVTREAQAGTAQRVHAALQSALQDPVFRARLAETGAAVAPAQTLEEAERFYATAWAQARQLIAEQGR